MRRINAANATPDHKFRDADPATGQKATSYNADWPNDVQESIMYPIERSGRGETANAHDLYRALVDEMFQVGDYKLTESNDSPAVRWTWQTWVEVKGRELVGFDESQTEFNAIGKQGGSKDRVLVVANLPDHDHPLRRATTGGNLNTGGNQDRYVPGGADNGERTGGTGSGQAFSILGPYRVVKMWRRTA